MKDFLSGGWGGIFLGLQVIALVALQRNMKFMNNAIE